MSFINKSHQSLLFGIAFTFSIAGIGFLLAFLPVFRQIGPLSVAILLAVIYRHFFGFPLSLKKGIQFSAKQLLRLAIILFGLKLNIHVIIEEGIPLLLRDSLVILFSIGFMMLLAKMIKADHSLSLLLGIGTGVCGASAIAAVSPILKAKEEDTALSAGIISLIGTVFAISYVILRPFLPIDAESYGMWAGLSLHEVAHVVLAGAPAGEEGLAMALLGKLGRVFLLVPLCLILMAAMKRKYQTSSNQSLPFPWFLVGFLVTSVIGSFVLGSYIQVSTQFLDGVSTATSFILTMAMVGLGLNVSLRDVRDRALKPIAAVIVTSILLSIVTFFMI
ncbi:membrane protein [Halobacillus andaensis]|uniref:Membrane protein n=1 Tax=Halobacillus andaensis TaxID=1176239 RepID=A0A917BD52_HALAA|nr:putative sulfate exporter family transporter [Halobacillus andaensis]MBP2006297.1 putative integral membrane protein (TIGR00698 family) [Halobacillus andaensis]GGF34087.1 membrane protein [Halobacillus andaensis]